MPCEGIGCELREINAHVETRQSGMTRQALLRQLQRRALQPAELLQVRRRDLDDALQELARRRLVARRVPQRLQRLVALPPVREVVEIDPMEIKIVLLPPRRVGGGRLRLRRAVRVTL